jgi:hypothetical protein
MSPVLFLEARHPENFRHFMGKVWDDRGIRKESTFWLLAQIVLNWSARGKSKKGKLVPVLN